MMKRLCSELLTIIIVVSIFFNFNTFFMGGPPVLMEFLVSIAYLIIWGLFFRYALKNKEYNLVLFSTIFWMLACLTSIVHIYININHATFDNIILFAIIFISPLYGLSFIFNHTFMLEISVIIISYCFLYFGIKFLIMKRKEQSSTEDKKREEKHIIKSQKIRKILNEAIWFWFIICQLLNFLRMSINPSSRKIFHIVYDMKEYNIFLAALPVSFIFILIVKLMEFYVQLNLKEAVSENNTIILWFIKHYNISYKKEQVILKDETCLLVVQLMLCFFGVFIGLRWYLTGALCMLFYFFLYIKLSFQDIDVFTQ